MSELWLFNERTIEIFDYTGETNALFRNKGIVIEQGCAATHSVCDSRHHPSRALRTTRWSIFSPTPWESPGATLQ